MAFPFLFHENFEKGTMGGFTSETDELGRIDFPDHNDQLEIPPWRGGYVMRVNLNRITSPDSFLLHNTALTMSAGQTRYIRFFIRLGRDFRISPGTVMDFLRVYSGALPGTSEIAIGLIRIDSWINLAIGSAEDQSHVGGLEIVPGEWTQVRVRIINGNGNGRVQLRVGRNTVENMRISMQPTTHFALGVLLQNPDVQGTFYIDDFIIDSEDIGEQQHLDASELSGMSILYTKSSYVFVGPGVIRGATLISGGTNNLAYFHDANRLPLAHHDIKAALKCSSAETKDVLIEDIEFKRGCYLEMTGTNPQVLVHYGESR